MALDATLVSPLGRDGQPRLRSHIVDGAALDNARRIKEQHTYSDVMQSRRMHFITAGLEIGGRWSTELLTFLQKLAKTLWRWPWVWMKIRLASWGGRTRGR